MCRDLGGLEDKRTSGLREAEPNNTGDLSVFLGGVKEAVIGEETEEKRKSGSGEN